MGFIEPLVLETSQKINFFEAWFGWRLGSILFTFHPTKINNLPNKLVLMLMEWDINVRKNWGRTLSEKRNPIQQNRGGTLSEKRNPISTKFRFFEKIHQNQRTVGFGS